MFQNQKDISFNVKLVLISTSFVASCGTREQPLKDRSIKTTKWSQNSSGHFL